MKYTKVLILTFCVIVLIATVTLTALAFPTRELATTRMLVTAGMAFMCATITLYVANT